VSGGRFDGLLVSPLEEPSRSRWWPVVAGVVVGAGVVAALFVLTADDEEGEASPPTSEAVALPSTTVALTTTVPVDVEASLFPAGYVPVSDVDAFKPHHVVRAGDRVVVSMTTSYARGLDPAIQPWFLGGTWVLDTVSGDSIVSEATLFDDAAPGGFSVLFPIPSGMVAEPNQLRLVERWEPTESTATLDFHLETGFDGFGHGPISIPMDAFVLRFDNVDPNNGEAIWELEGDPQPRGVVSLTVELMGPDDSKVATAQPSPKSLRPYGLGASQGTINLDLVPATPGYLDTVEKEVAFWNKLVLVDRLILHCTVTIGEPQPINEVAFDLTHLAAQNN
jgi:hypothetical protein